MKGWKQVAVTLIVVIVGTIIAEKITENIKAKSIETKQNEIT